MNTPSASKLFDATPAGGVCVALVRPAAVVVVILISILLLGGSG